ncbi:MAG: hypothetical protein DRO93_08245 [Candidatus Thorarchaeota archaeon]|nr:MAG: hypothetical protein DRO93_08245 [Candidatus Thorarchaeota archaeon]
MTLRWILNLCPFLHFDNSRVEDYEHNISIASWNVKSILDFLEIDESNRFAIGQATLLEGFKRLFPNYWDVLHQHVLEGRIEIVGGTYVMPDLIIPDGESIVRQFLHGTRFVRDELGVEPRTAWAIDSAGHCSQLPQILRQCGMDTYFLWRGVPHDAPSEFVWRGPDGSRVNVVWLVSGYDCAAWLSENTREAFTKLLGIVDSVGGRAASQNLFIPVGGELVPPAMHLSDIVREWNSTFEDMRAVIVTPREFAERLKAVQSQLPTITGPLCSGRFAPVRHGGLSSRISLKILNRQLETLLYLVELYLAVAGVQKQDEVENLWRILMFNQDHNIIRGTIADGPYLLAVRRYRQAIDQAEELLEETLTQIASRITDSESALRVAVFNPLPWSRRGIVRVSIDKRKVGGPAFKIVGPNGESVTYQVVDENETTAEVVFVATDVPSLGHQLFRVVPADERPEFENHVKTGPNWIECGRFSIEVDRFNGAITRVYDKENQFEVLRGSGNIIVMENDVGDLYRHDRSRLSPRGIEITSLRVSGDVKIVEDGPVRVMVEISGSIAGSSRIQRITMYDALDRIDFETELDFRGQDKRVSVQFPLTAFSERVTVGAQFGAEERSTSQDETDWVEKTGGTFAALDWVDCAGPDLGVTISTVGLHEFAFRDGLLRITLLRSVDHLSRGTDDEVVESETALEHGPHMFRYALIPHAGNWKQGKVWRAAAEHRLPLMAVPLDSGIGNDVSTGSLLTISGMDLVVSSVRPGRHENEVLVRLYEPAGHGGSATLEFDRPLKSAVLVDLREHEIGELPANGRTVTLPVDAHAILTVRVQFESRTDNE